MNLKLTSVFCVLLLLPSTLHAATGQRPARGTTNVYDQEAVRKAQFIKPLSSASLGKNIAEKFTALSVSFSHPEIWHVRNNVKYVILYRKNLVTDTSTTKEFAQRGAARIYIETRSLQKDYDLAQLDNVFTSNYTLSTDTTVSSDFYVPSYEAIGTTDATFMGQPARMYSYTGESGSIKFQGEDVMASFGKRLYWITYRATLDEFEKYHTEFAAIRDSIMSTSSLSKPASSALQENASSSSNKKRVTKRTPANSSSRSSRTSSR